VKTPGQDERSGKGESATQAADGERREFCAQAVELLVGEPKQGNGADSEGEGEFRALGGGAR
jgi:hypothetical protein